MFAAANESQISEILEKARARMTHEELATHSGLPPMPLDEQEIFEQALNIDDNAERNAFLAEACGNDVNVVRGVKSLLDSARDAASFMAKPAAGSLEVLANRKLPDRRGDSIDSYKLVEQIGEGGFGVVYMAEQQEPIQRRVALKIIKAGMDTKEVIARFEAERQALALMDHPNIPKVLDAGATEDERPFFVMELVSGVPITEYCDEHNLSTNQRLELFVRVCLAIQHAHQKGIIHRDIKPKQRLGIHQRRTTLSHGDRFWNRQSHPRTTHGQYADHLFSAVYWDPCVHES